MHDSLITRLKNSSKGVPALLNARGTCICLYDEDSGGPVWVSKSASNEIGVRRLRAEYDALLYLEPCAEQMNIPRVLDWEESPDGCTLVQSGIRGKHHPAAISGSASSNELNRRFGGVVAWINRLQQAVPSPSRKSLRRLAAEFAGRLEHHPEFGRIAASLASILRNPPVLGNRNAVPAHGDFYYRNVLFSGREVGVVDWGSFGGGFPLQDKFSYVVNSDYVLNNRCGTRLQNYHHVFFSPSRACSYALGMAKGAGWNEEQTRFLFYCFLATEICLDSDQIPVSDWCEILQYLDHYGYPTPGINLPPPATAV